MDLDLLVLFLNIETLPNSQIKTDLPSLIAE